MRDTLSRVGRDGSALPTRVPRTRHEVRYPIPTKGVPCDCTASSSQPVPSGLQTHFVCLGLRARLARPYGHPTGCERDFPQPTQAQV